MLVPVKRIDVLLRAAEIIVRRRPGVIFVIVGDGGQRDLLKARAAVPPLSGHVHFTGLRDDVPDLLSAFDVFALSSDDEAFGISLLEAMAAGCPVVATAVGGIPEVVEDGRSGLLVPRRDPDRMAEVILSLLEAPEWAKAMGLRGRQIARERFDVRRMVERVDALYQELLKEKGIRM
jgi:glycosyltransferase involved in cell wall biosynthesis